DNGLAIRADDHPAHRSVAPVLLSHDRIAKRHGPKKRLAQAGGLFLPAQRVRHRRQKIAVARDEVHIPPLYARYIDEAGHLRLVGVQGHAMADAAALEQLFTVVARDDHDGPAEIHLRQTLAEPGIHLQDRVLVAVHDAVAVAQQIVAIEIEILLNLGL